MFDEFIFAANSATLKCRSPAHLAGQLEFTGWLRDERLITGPDLFVAGADAGRPNRKRTMPLESPNAAEARPPKSLEYKYLLLANGDLYIRNASKSDVGSYKCRARNRLTGQTATSRLGGQLVVEEAAQRSQLRLAGPAESVVWSRENLDTLICAQIQSAPATRFTWFRVPLEHSANEGQQQQQLVGEEPSGWPEIRQLDACLLIQQVQLQHAADYICEAHDGASTLKSRVRLLISSAHLSAQVQVQVVQTTPPNHYGRLTPPQGAPLWLQPSAGQQVVPLGSTVNLNCSISGFPFDTIGWFKDTKLIALSAVHNQSDSTQTQQHQQSNQNVKLVQATVISIEGFALRDRGVYQCQVYSARAPLSASSQDSNATKLGQPPRGYNEGHAERDYLRSASSSVQLELNFVKPVITQRFQNLTVQRGSQISLQCAASGLPVPRIMWFLDNQLISPVQSKHQYRLKPSDYGNDSDNEQLDSSPADRYFLAGGASETSGLDQFAIGQSGGELVFNQANENEPDESEELAGLMATFLGAHQPASLQASIRDERFQMSWRTGAPSSLGQLGTVVSQLNVSQAQSTEGGQYRCVALNPLGVSRHEALVSVPSLGHLELRSYQATNVTLVAGRSASLQCPLVGYPLSRVDWFRDNRRLPANHRQRLEPVRQGQGGQLVLSNVDRQADGGLYTCRPVLQVAKGNASSGESAPAQDDYDFSDLVGQVRAQVRVAPLIDSQSLPEVVQANEGVRVKLVCSLSQGDQPAEIKWLKRSNDRDKVTLIGGARLTGFELMRNTEVAATNQEPLGEAPKPGEDSVSIHNLEDSCLLTFKQIAYTDSADYLCLAANEVAHSTRLTRLIVNVAPSWSVEPTGQLSVLLNGRLQLDCAAHGFPAPTVSWRRELPEPARPTGQRQDQFWQDQGAKEDSLVKTSEFISMISNYRQRAYANGSLVIDQADQTDAGLYMCEVANGVGSGLSKVVRVRVNVPPHFRHRLATQLSQLGAKAELGCAAYGDQPMAISWRKEGAPTVELASEHKPGPQSLSESALHIDNVTRNDSGQYVCTASNEFGAEEMRIQLVVQEPPEPPLLLRPLRAGSRQATLSFRPPYSGNSPIKKYAVSFKLLDWLPALANSTPVGAGAEPPIKDQLNWQQVLLDAPAAGEAPPLILGGASAANESAYVDKTGGRSQLVNLNLCCLQPFTRYVVRVKAINDIGQSEPSKLAQLITDEETIGGPPLDVGVEATGAHSLKVRWRAPARNLQNGLIRGYYIGYRANLPAGSPTASAGAMAALQSELHQSPSANVKVFEGGEGEQYQYKNVQLDSSPLNSFRQPAAPFSIPPESGVLNFMDLSVQQALNSTPQVFTSYLTNLRRKTAYSIIVQAYNKIGAGPRSDQILVSTLDAAPPMSPVLRLLSVSYSSVQLVWSARRFNQAPEQTGKAANESPGLQRPDELEQQLEEEDDPQSYYTINYRAEDRAGSASTIGDAEWQQRRIQKRQSLPLVLNNLRCGSPHAAFMTATNSLGQSEPGEIIKFATMGAAPLAPSNSRQLLEINSTYLVLRLSAWQNAGCLISSFILKFKLLNQMKWTILEHQVHPALRTATISGSAVFSTRAASSSDVEETIGRGGKVDSYSSDRSAQQLEEPSSRGAIKSQLVNRAQSIGDFVLRNLLAQSSYKLIVEANSEAGTTVAEYDLETGNFTSNTISVNVNGISALDLINGRSSHAAGKGPASPDAPADLSELDFSYSGGQRASSGGFGGALQKYSFGLWSMTALAVAVSIFMALTALVLGFRSLIRMKSMPNNSKRSNESLISAILCCQLNSSSNSSNADSSHSSSGGTCYQVATDLNNYCPNSGLMLNNNNNGNPTRVRLGTAATISGNMLGLEGYVGGELKNIMSAAHHADDLGLPFRQMVTSSSLSTIGGHQPASRFAGTGGANRNTYTLASAGHCQAAERRYSGDEQHPLGGAQLAQANIRNHYAATLGKQNSQHNSFMHSSQSMKYNDSSSPLYGRLQPAKMLNHHNGVSLDTQTALYVASNQLGGGCHPGQQQTAIQQQQQQPISSSGTSGYGTTSNSIGNNKMHLDNECELGIYLPTNLDQNAAYYHQMNMFSADGIAESGNLFPGANNQQTAGVEGCEAPHGGNLSSRELQNHQDHYGCNLPGADGKAGFFANSRQEQQSLDMDHAGAITAYGMIFGDQSQQQNGCARTRQPNHELEAQGLGEHPCGSQ